MTTLGGREEGGMRRERERERGRERERMLVMFCTFKYKTN